jgi:hypothetical protein
VRALKPRHATETKLTRNMHAQQSSDGRPTQNHLWQCTTDVSAQRDTVTRAVHLSSDRTLEILTTRLSKLNKTRCMLKELCKHNQRNVT